MSLKQSDYLDHQIKICQENDEIAPRLYSEYGINLGLRDPDGKGVLTGLTNISAVNGTKVVGGKRVPCEGELWYRGYRIETLINNLPEDAMGFGKIAYLLLMGELPSDEELKTFVSAVRHYRKLPTNFVRDVIMKAPSSDIMNSMSRSILTLASYDPDAKNPSLKNNLRQCIQLIGQFPMLAVYAYHAHVFTNLDGSMYVHNPKSELSTAENFLMMLRPDQSFTPVEAKTLDTAMILHMEHGGGNNSTFTTRVVTSSGSDTYSTISAAMSSLKGPKHGGANIKVMNMMKDIRQNVKDYSDKDEIAYYLRKILAGEVLDHKGLIYGMGHAVYTLSDPREKIFKKYVKELAQEKGRENDLLLYENIEEIAPKIINEKRKNKKPICANVDFYSGFVFNMLDIPIELYTPLFAVARIVGWSAHRMEELICTDKIIRPAYMSVMEKHEK